MDRQERDTPENILEHWSVNSKRAQRGHYLAAIYFARLNYFLGIPTAIMATLVASTVFASLGNAADNKLGIATGIVSMLAAILASLQTFLGFSEKASKHRASGVQYGCMKREIQENLLKLIDNRNGAIDAVNIVRSKIDALAKDSPQVPDRIWKMVEKEMPCKPAEYYHSCSIDYSKDQAAEQVLPGDNQSRYRAISRP